MKRTRPNTGDPLYDLLGAVYRLAIKDARGGDAKAAAWLWQTAPELAAQLGLVDMVQAQLAIGD